MQNLNFTCAKCSHTECESSQVRMSGGGISAFFNLENKRFSTVTCARCGYTEMYKGEVSALAKVFDLFGG